METRPTVYECLNPCSNGMTIESSWKVADEGTSGSLNPCSNGMTIELGINNF